MSITGMTHPDTKKRVDVFALSFYGVGHLPHSARAHRLCSFNYIQLA
ncbi:hypothetical protein Goarm_012556 [Gossypium armourianum]|uniref:Uncharacterized protein n=1 Tax=Gossypium armourianum TaxID=34283 RepID=A0A7J9J0B4_9ROSI|nr:hypothetical protein [Gossypium armourianum]